MYTLSDRNFLHIPVHERKGNYIPLPSPRGIAKANWVWFSGWAAVQPPLAGTSYDGMDRYLLHGDARS